MVGRKTRGERDIHRLCQALYRIQSLAARQRGSSKNEILPRKSIHIVHDQLQAFRVADFSKLRTVRHDISVNIFDQRQHRPFVVIPVNRSMMPRFRNLTYLRMVSNPTVWSFRPPCVPSSIRATSAESETMKVPTTLIAISNLAYLGLCDVGAATTYFAPYIPNKCYHYDRNVFPSDKYFAAVGQGLWENGAACGRHYELLCITPKGANSQCIHKAITVKIIEGKLGPKAPLFSVSDAAGRNWRVPEWRFLDKSKQEMSSSYSQSKSAEFIGRAVFHTMGVSSKVNFPNYSHCAYAYSALKSVQDIFYT
ncbi:hypothetical protein E6O75_ATG11571 [Venturia nashicola]|uniref:Uncharacterized protein n=1 Tax=Venturia nashicola TaxID=86259 RepID=A0A4Z1P400_9PEZI|nr:hypothetical protein E6O75_ATG11571 [Venturia nashicola]